MERFAGRYLLLRKLGRGGMGEVFLARDLSRWTECALKRLTVDAPDLSPELLRREFEALARVRHPAVVAVQDLGIAADGTPFITMEYVPGLSSERAIAPGDWPGVFFVATRVASALEAIHSAGFVHGDLKPSNLIVMPSPTPGGPPASVRLVDFGLAAMLGRDVEGHRGTQGYAAPEVVTGAAPSVASDLYGLGATLYQLACGRAPFADEKPEAMLRRQQSAPPSSLPLEDAGCPAALIEIILRLMAVAPAERPRDATEVRRDLERAHPASRRPLDQRLDGGIVVGRGQELGLLERRLAEAAKRTRVVVLSGEPGIGKTSLLDQMAARAALSGRSVARCSSATSPDPGAAALVLTRILAAGAGVDPVSDDSAPPALRESGSTVREADVTALVDAAVRWAGTIAQQGAAPLVLLDDTEQLDPLSRAILRRMILHPDAPPALWVLARRDQPGAMADDERILEAAGVVEAVPLRGLDKNGIERLAAARLGEAAPAELVDFLVSRGGGHPGISVELLRAAAASGGIAESEAGLTVDRAKLDAVQTPGDFEATLLARVAGLSDAARAAGFALATWARPVTRKQLVAIEPAATGVALDELLGSGLAGADASGLLSLRPPALAERLRRDAPIDRSQSLHRAVLTIPGLSHRERFEHLRALGDVAAALGEADLAFAESREFGLAIAAAQLAEETAPREAAAWYERAGRERLDRGRPSEAVAPLEQAVALEPEGEAWLERMERLGRAQGQSGRIEDLEETIRRARTIRLDDRMQARFLWLEVFALQGRLRFDEAAGVARRVLTLAAATGDAECAAYAHLAMSAGHIQLKAFSEARVAADGARRAFAALRDIHGETTATGNLAIIEIAEGHRDKALDLFRQGVVRARATDSRYTLQRQLAGLGGALTELGRWNEALDADIESMRIAMEDQDPGLVHAMANLAQLFGLTGRPRASLRRGVASFNLARAINPRYEPFALRSQALAHRVSGRYREALRTARLAMRSAGPGTGPVEIEWLRVELTRALMSRGRWAEAEKVIRAAVGRTKSPGSVGHLIAMCLAGVLAVRRGDTAEAERLLASVQSFISKSPAAYAAGMARVLRSQVHFLKGEVDEGVRAAGAALNALGQLPAPADKAWAAYEISRVAGSMADPPSQIGEWLETAAATFERLGDHRARARALALQVRWIRRTSGAGASMTNGRGLIEHVSALLHSLPETQELAQRAMQMAVEQLQAERGVLLVFDAESDRLLPMAEVGRLDPTTRESALGYSRRVVQRVTQSGASLVFGDAVTDPTLRSESVVDLNLRSIVCVPLYLGGRVIGAVYLDDSRRPEAFGEDDRSMLEGFAHLMAVAIERSRGHVEALQTNERLVGENLSLREQVGARFKLENLIGLSPGMRRVIANVEQAAQVNATVLLTGEMGTGKELVARTLHHVGKARAGRFVAVNCGAIPETLLESELFGILPDVATGVKGRPGRFLEADGGTLFLDEIGEMPLKHQVALLSVLSNREVTPVGGGKAVSVNVRVVSATNRDLGELVEAGRFRKDLFYRLNVIQIELPPLRERKADIPLLATRFVADIARDHERTPPKMAPEFIAALMQSDWPGNVRELQNYIERVMAMTPGDVLFPQPPPRDLEERAGTIRLRSRSSLGDMVEELERKMLREALERADGNQSRAARELGLKEQSLRYRIKKYGLESVREKRRAR